MNIAPDIIDRTLCSPHGQSALKIVETLEEAGHEAWWVGGPVRDMLRGSIPDDIDIATRALPEEIVGLFPKCDASSARFGSVIVALGGSTFELTTFREDDTASDGRHPESVRFGNRQQDALRRDFTMNAIYWHPVTGEIFDPLNGRKDLHENLVRFIGLPEVRIKHDALRLLRAVRFRALIGGQYHPDTFQALHIMAQQIDVLSGSRRFEEMEKMLLGPRPHIAFEDLWETDIIEYLLPELHRCKGVAQNSVPHGEGDVWNHIVRILSSFTDDHGPDARWAALLHDIGKPETFSIEEDRIHFNEHASVGAAIARKILDRLQCPGHRRDKICWVVAHHMMMHSFDDMTVERKAHWYYHPWFIDLLQLFWLDIASTDPSDFSLYDEIIADYNAYLDANPRPPKPLISGDDVMDILGIQPGETVGKILRELYQMQLKKSITTKREAQEHCKNIKNKL